MQHRINRGVPLTLRAIRFLLEYWSTVEEYVQSTKLNYTTVHTYIVYAYIFVCAHINSITGKSRLIMSNCPIIGNMREETDGGLCNNFVVLHQIEKKRIKNGGSINQASNGPLHTTTTSKTSAKLSVISAAEGKSIVSSLSMSLERKDSIQYMPRKVDPHTIPAGQNTIVHLDNYTRFMAQRVTTTKTIKRAEIISEGYNSIVPCSASGSNGSVGGGIVDVDLKVILGSVGSPYPSNNIKTLNMNKKKTQDLKSITPSKKRGRKSPECKKANEENKSMDIEMNKAHTSITFKRPILKKSKPDTSTTVKPILKKAKLNRRKKVIKARRGIKTKIKAKPGPKSAVISKNAGEQDAEEALQISPTAPSKILRPCVYTLQSKKCLSEISCPYLHSDFPCKYYYLNLPCPQDLKCQFMHNGPLRTDLRDALRSHILDLLSTKPSATEIHFIEQMHHIEDLSQRLYSFQNNQDEHEEVIEIMDDVDDNLVLILDESSNDFSTNEQCDQLIMNSENMTTTNSVSNTLNDTAELDDVFKSIKETNSAVDLIDKKLKFLKTSNMPPNDKISELQNIYDLLKAQEKRLKVYENLNNLSPNTDNAVNLLNPQIINDIQISEFATDNDENFMTITELECSQAINSDTPKVAGTEFLNNEEENVLNEEHTVEYECSKDADSNLPPQQGDIEIISVETSPQSDSDGRIGTASYPKDIEINDLNMTPNIKGEEETSNVNFRESHEETQNMNEVTKALNAKNNESTKSEEVMFKSKQFEFKDCLQNADENVGKNDSLVFDENKSFNLHNETIELEINNDEKEVIENNMKEIANEAEEIEEKSPPYEDHSSTKPEKRNRICLRSHSLQDNEETIAATKPFRSRRLRLPKPSRKKEHMDECPTNTEVEKALVQEEEAPSTQNVILTKRFLKKTKQTLDPQSIFHENEPTIVEQNMLALHSEDKIENIKNNNDINLSQDPMIVESVSCNAEIANSDIPTSSENFNKHLVSGREAIKITNSKHNNTAFENPTSSSTIVEKFHLGNPHVVLTKLKNKFLLQTTQKDMQADSTTSYLNPTVTSSTLSAENISKQKRRCFIVERDVDSSLKGSKKLKMDNSKSTRKVKIANRTRTLSQQSIISKDSDFEIESNDEKLSKASSYSNNEQDEAFEMFLTHEQQQNPTHQCEDKEMQDNESDLRQQIENGSNKSDLQLQFQQHEQQEEEQGLQQQKELKNISTATDFITGNNKNLPHEQYQQHENLLAEEKENTEDLLHHKREHDGIDLEEGEITNTSDSYDAAEKGEDERIDKPEELSSSPNDKYSNEITLMEKRINVEYSTYSSLLNKLQNHSKKCQINFENSSVNITPISSPTYGNDTIASPSPIKKLMDFRMGGEIDGSLTYPPIPYILHEIDLGKIEVNKPQFIDKLKKTIQLDPRIFKTHIKKQSISFCESFETTSSALVPLTTSNTFNLTHESSSSFVQPTTKTNMISPYDPRNRTSALMTEVATTPSLSQQTALTPYNSMQTAAVSSASSFFRTVIPNAVPIALQYHSSSQPIVQPQQQQTPNMFLYGCLQRSSWYQSLMSTMKIQINQSISQLIRALNNFHRERAFNPEILFDVFKIDCAGEILEIMRNLGIFVDANGVINEQRHDPSFVGRSCCNEMPANATYSSLIQQFLTPHTHCSSLTTPSSSYNTAGCGQLNVNEPILSCYVNAPEPPQKNSDDSITTYKSQQNDNNSNRNCNCNCSSNSNTNTNSNTNANNYRNDNDNNQNNNNNNRRYGNSFKKQYDNNKGNNNTYQQRPNQRSSYNNNSIYKNNPRFMKPGSCSPTRANSSPTNSPKENFDSGSGGHFNNNNNNNYNNKRRFNNYNNNDNKNNGNGKSSWDSSSSNEKRYNNKYQSNNSPSHDFAPNSPFQSGSPRATESKARSPPPQKPATTNLNDEECWDSDG